MDDPVVMQRVQGNWLLWGRGLTAISWAWDSAEGSRPWGCTRVPGWCCYWLSVVKVAEGGKTPWGPTLGLPERTGAAQLYQEKVESMYLLRSRAVPWLGRGEEEHFKLGSTLFVHQLEDGQTGGYWILNGCPLYVVRIATPDDMVVRIFEKARWPRWSMFKSYRVIY